jgi:transcriptional accessory protein Tex/SPT6
VKVLEVDAARKRIALTMRLDDEVAPKTDGGDKAPKVDRKTSERYMGGGQPKRRLLPVPWATCCARPWSKKTRAKKYFSSHLVALPSALLV